MGPEFVQTEVTFICLVRRAFSDAGGHYFFSKCLELGGLLHPLSGLDESPSSVVLSCAFPQRGGAPEEVPVRTELGDPRGEELHAASRSDLHATWSIAALLKFSSMFSAIHSSALMLSGKCME